MWSRFALLALMLVASASSASIVYKASLTGSSVVPPVTTKATGSVSITLINTSRMLLAISMPPTSSR